MHSCNFPLLSINNKNIHSTFWQLWDEHKDYLYHCCIKWMSNINDAEDVLSQAMLKAWNKISNCTVEIKDFKTYVTKLTYNLCVDTYRELHSLMEYGNSWEVICDEYEEILVNKKEENPLFVATQQELENFFEVVIDELPSRLRETFILYWKEEFSYQEIGEKLNVSYDNVRKRISQARAILKQRYHQDFIREEDRYSSDLDECESQAFSQSPKRRRKSQNTNQTEISTGEILALSDELQTETMVNHKEPEQAVTTSQFMVVDLQSDWEIEEVRKTPDINEEYLPKDILKKFGLLCNQKLSLQDFLVFLAIVNNKLFNFVGCLNFKVRQDTQTTRFKGIFVSLLNLQTLWQVWADSGG